MYISESSWGNLTQVSTHSNFCMGNLTKVSTHLNFRMRNLTKVFIRSDFYISNLTKVSTHLNFHTDNLVIQPHLARYMYNNPNLSTGNVSLSRRCYNPHLTLLMLPYCTEQAVFVQSIYKIYSFVTGHVSNLFLWINQLIPCTITNFADGYSEFYIGSLVYI